MALQNTFYQSMKYQDRLDPGDMSLSPHTAPALIAMITNYQFRGYHIFGEPERRG